MVLTFAFSHGRGLLLATLYVFLTNTLASIALFPNVPGDCPASVNNDTASISTDSNLIMFNGTIHTMDVNDTVVSAVAIKDGRFVYVGNSIDEARCSFVHQPRTLDLAGKTTLPGLIDSHNHIVLFGNRPGYHTPLENVYSVQDVLTTLQNKGYNVPKGSFITTIGGFHPNQFAERRLPTLAELDRALPDHPVFISYSFSGPSVTNSLGRAWLATADPPSNISSAGAISAGTENGKALLALRRVMTFEDRKRSVQDAMKYAVSMGVTTHIDQGAFPASNTPSDGAANEDLYAMHLPWLSVYGEGKGIIRLRTNFLHMDSVVEVPTLQQRLLNSFKFFGDTMFRTGGIGEYISANASGGPIFEEAARQIAKAGWRAEVHSLSGTDFQEQIQAFEKVNAQHDITKLRWVIAHVPKITREYLARLKQLGGGVNLSGWQYLAGRGPNAGPPFKDILESGIPAGIGADGMQIAPMNPWIHAYYATTGKNALGERINEGQQISRADVLRMYTRANQWFLGGPDEHQLGSIEVGRLGDVVVLDADYFKVSEEDLRHLKVLATVVGGRIVYLSNDKVLE